MTNNPIDEQQVDDPALQAVALEEQVEALEEQAEALEEQAAALEEQAEALEEQAAALEEQAVEADAEKSPEVLAKYQGVPMLSLPDDLYIPPDALEVFLDAFEGPLDLLLYLIRKNNLDILNIPIADITRQYIEYVEIMKEIRLELAADYLVMAATLAEIKSRMLLPRSEEAKEEEDPRAELVRRLQEYERIKHAAERLEQLPRMGRDIFSHQLFVPDLIVPKAPPKVELAELLSAFVDILKRSELLATHRVSKEALSVRERMSLILEKVNAVKFIAFHECFDLTEGRLGVVVSFIAILELMKIGLIDIVQTEAFGPIHVTQCSVVYEGQATNEIFTKNNEESEALLVNVDEY